MYDMNKYTLNYTTRGANLQKNNNLQLRFFENVPDSSGIYEANTAAIFPLSKKFTQ